MKEAGLSTSLDTNDDPTGTWAGPIAESLKYVDILMPNEREAMALSGKDSVELAIAHLSRLVPLLVVKRGSLGAVVLDRGLRLEQPAFSVTLVDAVGAGDSFNAGFLHGYLNNWPMERCLLSGNLAGAYSTTQIGGASAFREKRLMEQFFDMHAPGLFSHA
jgi:sugar/nucleoside kinase (ribokinase family)